MNGPFWFLLSRSEIYFLGRRYTAVFSTICSSYVLLITQETFNKVTRWCNQAQLFRTLFCELHLYELKYEVEQTISCCRLYVHYMKKIKTCTLILYRLPFRLQFRHKPRQLIVEQLYTEPPCTHTVQFFWEFLGKFKFC